MEITNLLIQKFFANKCTEEEFEAVRTYLEDHPEVAVKEMGWIDWVTTDPAAVPPVVHQDEVYDRLRTRFFPRKMRSLYWPAAAAAAIILVIGGWALMRSPKNVAPTTAAARPAAVAIQWKTLNNPHTRSKSFTLPDGSRVKLMAHSTLRYNDSFGVATRQSWLDGGAVFTVKKDKAHPFTVHSKELATTALGTVFGVTTNHAMETVKLFSGKVVVKGWSKDVYLEPGQEIVYDNKTLTLNHFRSTTAAPAIAPTPKEQQDQDLTFNNSSLKEVFGQLSIQYHTKFNFRAQDLSGLNFTGTVPRTDSLEVFLRLLSGMNNLAIQKDSTGYSVSPYKE